MIDEGMAEYAANTFLLGLLIYREAAGEPRAGKIAVGFTVMNRAAHPAWWGKDPYSVITKPEQYSSMTHPGDPMTVKFPPLTDRVFLECLDIARGIFLGEFQNTAPGCDSYYAKWMDEKHVTPKWAQGRTPKFIIGNHKFYDLDGDPARAG